MASGPDVVHVFKYASRYIMMNLTYLTVHLTFIMLYVLILTTQVRSNAMGTNDNSMTSTFLDVDIFIDDNKFGTKVYDKI